jgi:uncharacterized oxidoreductase
MMRIGLEPLRGVVRTTFERAGCPSDEAARIALYLSKANLAGHDSHGVIRVPRYVEYLASGLVYAGRHVRPVLDTPGLAILDGQMGFGQTIGPEACQMGIDRARSQGAAVIGLKNTGHLGRIGDFAEMSIEADIVSIHFVNAFNSLLVAPFGSRSRRFSTNPIAIGVPTGDDRPFVLDFATAMVAEGKVLVAHQGGKPVPDNALVDEDGHLTGDPLALYGTGPEGAFADPRRGKGALRTFGEHKGSGLALACELLGGALTGSGSNAAPEGTFHNGMLSIYLDPRRFDLETDFAAEARAFVEGIRGAEPIDRAEGVLVPGDKERKTAAERREGGIPLSDETWAAILAAARRSGVTDAEIDQLTSRP